MTVPDSGATSMRTSRARRPLLPKPPRPAPMSAFDKQVLADRAAKVAKVRENSASEALAFLSAEPLDKAGPLTKK
jgi:hypothetical protein